MINEYNFYFNKYKTKDLGLILSEYPDIPFLVENTDPTEVLGKDDGALIEKLGTFKDRTISCTFKLIDEVDYDKTLSRVKRWIKNIEDNRLFIDKDRYFKVKNIEAGNISRQLFLYGEFTVNFICSPFIYGDTTEINISANNVTIENFGDYKTPIIAEIYGTGNIKIGINEESMTIENVEGYIKIDGDKKSVVNADGTSKDWDTIGEFLMLEVGTNNVVITGSITKIIIKYNERYY